jgi:hypothetical protein
MIRFHFDAISAVFDPAGKETEMGHHLTRAQLYRILVGAVSTLVLCGIAVFAGARHLA